MSHPVTSRHLDIVLTGLAPAIWGSTYYVTTEFLPDGYPITVAMLRALPAGLLLLLFVRRLPAGVWWGRVFVLGALNFSIFWTMLFVAAYRLPGGVAATVGALQPLVVIVLARICLGSPIRLLAIVAAIAGMGGVGLLILTPAAALDPIGLLAGFAGAVSMAAGTVLTRRWTPPVPLLTFTAWQLAAGGLLLLPLALALEPPLPPPSAANLAGFAYLGLIGAALTYVLWFRGIARIEPSAVSTLVFLSPLSAVLIGWIGLGQTLTLPQAVGVAVVFVAIWLGQAAQAPRPDRVVGPSAVRPAASGR